MTARHLWQPPRTLPLQQRYEQLALTTQALWELLKSRLDIDEAALLIEIDRAAVRNATATTTLTLCDVCRHPVQVAAKCCLYCGTAPQRMPLRHAAPLSVQTG